MDGFVGIGIGYAVPKSLELFTVHKPTAAEFIHAGYFPSSGESAKACGRIPSNPGDII